MSPVQIRAVELPAAFVRSMRPVVANRCETGLARCLMDPHALAFFRGMTTAEPVPPAAVWSVVPLGGEQDRHARGDSLRLITGEHAGAVGYVVTDVPWRAGTLAEWLLPRKLTLRQRIASRTLADLAAELRAAPIAVPDEVLEFIQGRADHPDQRGGLQRPRVGA